MEKEIEITREMMEAGLKVLLRADCEEWVIDKDTVVSAIYVAMRSLDRGSVVARLPEGS